MKQECSELAGKLNKVETTIELKCYRVEARVKKQWEVREDRLVQQLKELQYQKLPKDVSVNPGYTLTGQQESPQYSASHYQSTKGIQWVNVKNISEEDPMVMGEKVSKPVIGNLGSSDAVASVNVFNAPLSHVPSNVKCEQPLVRTSSTISEIINSDPTVTCVDHFATALLAQRLPSGESSDGEMEIKTFQEWLDQFEMVADACNWSLQA